MGPFVWDDLRWIISITENFNELLNKGFICISNSLVGAPVYL